MKLSINIEILEHTADIGLRIRAATLADLLKAAATGMFRIICPNCLVASTVHRSVEAEGDDLEQLLVNWLSELNFIFQTEPFLLAKVVSIQIKDLSIRAEIAGESRSLREHEIGTEIKAVTYHKIYVREDADGWEAQLIFDI